MCDAKMKRNFIRVGFNDLTDFKSGWVMNKIQALVEGCEFEDDEDGVCEKFRIISAYRLKGNLVVDMRSQDDGQVFVQRLVEVVDKLSPKHEVRALIEMDKKDPFSAMCLDFLKLKDRVPLSLQTNGLFFNVQYSKAKFTREYCAFADILS